MSLLKIGVFPPIGNRDNRPFVPAIMLILPATVNIPANATSQITAWSRGYFLETQLNTEDVFQYVSGVITCPFKGNVHTSLAIRRTDDNAAFTTMIAIRKNASSNWVYIASYNTGATGTVRTTLYVEPGNQLGAFAWSSGACTLRANTEGNATWSTTYVEFAPL